MVAIGKARPKSGNLQWELRMRDEYLIRYHASDQVKTHVRLGGIPGLPEGTILPDNQLKMLGVFRRFADAMVVQDNQVLLIEFALLAHPGDISQLELYGKLFRATPEMQQYNAKHLELQLIGAIEDPVVVPMARERKIRWILYTPAWLDEYLSTLAARKQRAAAT